MIFKYGCNRKMTVEKMKESLCKKKFKIFLMTFSMIDLIFDTNKITFSMLHYVENRFFLTFQTLNCYLNHMLPLIFSVIVLFHWISFSSARRNSPLHTYRLSIPIFSLYKLLELMRIEIEIYRNFSFLHIWIIIVIFHYFNC